MYPELHPIEKSFGEETLGKISFIEEPIEYLY